jgi:hypothetical protein
MSRAALLVFGLVALLLIPTVSAFSLPSIGGNSSTGSLLGIFNVNSTDTPVYAGFFALLVLITIYVALQRTTLGTGAAAISVVFAAIVFVALFTQPWLIQIFLGTVIGTALLALVLLVMLIPSKRGSTLAKLLGVILLTILFYLIISNNSSLLNAVNKAAGFNVKNILPLVIVGAMVLAIIILLLGAFKKTSKAGVKLIIALIILGLLIFFFVPGAGAFLLSPYTIAFYVLVFILFLFLELRQGKTPYFPYESKTGNPPNSEEKHETRPVPVASAEHLPTPAPKSSKGPLKEWVPPSGQQPGPKDKQYKD